MIVIGVDPGKMTGIAHVDLDDLGRGLIAQMPAVQAVKYVWNLIECTPVVVRCERYDITGQTSRKSRQLDAVHVQGAIKIKCDIHGVEYDEYGRSDAKAFATDEKLREMKMYDRALTHGMDGARQVVMYLADAGLLPKLKL